MRVLHVLGELRASGAEVMTLAAIPLWAKAGIETHLLSTGEVPGFLAKKMEEAGGIIHHLPFRKSPRHFGDFYLLLKRNAYGVVHIHCERANFYYGLVALLEGCKVVRTIHASFTFSGFLAARRVIQRRILTVLGVHHVAVSEEVSRVEEQVLRNRVITIPNWIDDERFRPPNAGERMMARRNFGIPNDALVLVTVGNCEQVKNHLAVIGALAGAGEVRAIMYLHVGQETGKEERDHTKRLGVSDRVRFLGPLDDVRPALFASDVFVMPSLKEGFGIAAIEALATGLPSILSDVEGLRDFKQIPGALLTPPDEAALRSLLLGLHGWLPDAKNMAKAASTFVRKNYGKKRGATAYMELYKSISRDRPIS